MKPLLLSIFNRAFLPLRKYISHTLATFLDDRSDSDERELALLPRAVGEMMLPMPPPEIRYRVVNRPESRLQHLKTGLNVKISMEIALRGMGLTFHDFDSILDWGCGCSRVLRHLQPLLERASLTGFDIDGVTVEWSRRHIEGVSFAVNNSEPPLPCGDERFDLIYGISVFSHLDEFRQQVWLQELRRVLRPGGILIVSTHGDTAYEMGSSHLPVERRQQYTNNGFTFIENILDGILPEWYQTAFQTETHVRATFGRFFDVECFLFAGVDGYQDLVVCRKV